MLPATSLIYAQNVYNLITKPYKMTKLSMTLDEDALKLIVFLDKYGVQSGYVPKSVDYEALGRNAVGKPWLSSSE
jgi:hypothetical protein